MERIRNYQVQLLEKDMEKLKIKTGTKGPKSALEKAVEWALEREDQECP